MNIDWAITTPLFVAFAGYVATYLNNLAINVRKDRLERVNRQLAELYGPLYALSRTTDISRQAFRQKYHPGKLFLPTDAIKSDEMNTAIKLWMSEVFMPFNMTMEKLIVEHADLLIGEEMPQCLLELCAHVASHRVIIKRWESGDLSEYAALVPFPREDLLKYSEASFRQLKQEQTKLLRALEHGRVTVPLALKPTKMEVASHKERKPMAVRQRRYGKEVLAQRGQSLYESSIRQQVEAGNDGKIVAIDIETGEFEVDENVVPATNRLFERLPDAQPWIIRIGHRAVYHFGARSLKKNP